MDILHVSNVSKSFGEKSVLQDVSFCVKENSIYGFIGQNGAGKTTMMKLILGLLPMESGEITVCGETVVCGRSLTSRFTGYLPDVPEFYSYLTPREYLELCAAITDMSRNEAAQRIEEMLRLVGLKEDQNRRIKGFSRGMKQRLGIAQALLPKPQLVICDEPTSALDPVGRKEILDILKAASAHTTILLSTHILPDVVRVCDTVGMLHNGRVAWQGALCELPGYKDTQRFESFFKTPESLLEDLFIEVMDR